MDTEQLYTYLERSITERHLAGDKAQLQKLQSACGVVMAAANDADAVALAKRFQILAARAANLLEKLGEKGSR
jgi:hypothetical protein